MLLIQDDRVIQRTTAPCDFESVFLCAVILIFFNARAAANAAPCNSSTDTTRSRKPASTALCGFGFRSAVDAGFLDLVVSVEELQGAALAAARQLKKINMTAHKNTKLKVRKVLLETLDNAITLDQEHLG